MGDFERVVLICVDAEVFYFVERDGLVFGWFGIGGDVFLGVRSECSDVYFPGRHGAVWVNLPQALACVLMHCVMGEYDDSHPWVLKLLVLELRRNVDAR